MHCSIIVNPVQSYSPYNSMVLKQAYLCFFTTALFVINGET